MAEEPAVQLKSGLSKISVGCHPLEDKGWGVTIGLEYLDADEPDSAAWLEADTATSIGLKLLELATEANEKNGK